MSRPLAQHILLIQAADPPPAVTPIDATGGHTVRFAPAWELLCLQAFLNERTGHSSELVDTRLYETLSEAFDATRYAAAGLKHAVAVIHTATEHLGLVMQVVAHLRRHHPDVIVTLSGPHVNAYPETLSLLPGVRYGLRGDPEVVLRHLIDALDVPHRLKLIPGLILPDTPDKPAHWVNDLRALSLPRWEANRWKPYAAARPGLGLSVEARLSRGHPGTAADLAFPGPDEPVRTAPLAGMVTLLQKCAAQGIIEVHFADPPGYWTDDNILEWCRQLGALRNSQPWSIRIMARALEPDLCAALAGNGCRRLEILIPSPQPEVRSLLGSLPDDDELARMSNNLHKAGIMADMIYWIASPFREQDSAGSIIDHARRIGAGSIAAYPFPFLHDTPLYRSMAEEGTLPTSINEWLEWAQKEGTEDAPIALWTGRQGAVPANQTLSMLHRRISRNPWRMLRRLAPGLDQWRGHITGIRRTSFSQVVHRVKHALGAKT